MRPWRRIRHPKAALASRASARLLGETSLGTPLGGVGGATSRGGNPHSALKPVETGCRPCTWHVRP